MRKQDMRKLFNHLFGVIKDPMPDRARQLEALAVKRANSTPRGFKNIGEYHDGAYECAYVSPYTKAAHNLYSPILLILQDWISDDVLAGPLLEDAKCLGRLPNLPTNRNLDRLLKAHFDVALSETYATNLFPFIKPGNMSRDIPFSALREAAREYGLPQIDIIEPRLVVALGLKTFNALRVETTGTRSASVGDAIASPFQIGRSMVWCQAHPGALGQNGRNRNNEGQTDRDWSTMAQWLRADAEQIAAGDV